MIQVTGLTKTYRRGRPPALLDLAFDARPGTVTVLLGDRGAGKSTALRLMVELERGHGAALFDGRTYRRLRAPERHVGVLLTPSGRRWPQRAGRVPPGPAPTGAAVPSHPFEPGPTGPRSGRPGNPPGAAPLLRGGSFGHPDRRAADHLRMLAAAVGVPPGRADELLEQTRLAGVAEQRLRTFSPGMNRRLALAAALLGDPAVLLLDAPTDGLSERAAGWFHAFLRSFAVSGGNVVVTSRSTREAAVLADRVVTLEAGRPVADQSADDFRRTRLFPEVAVRGPQMSRLADVLRAQGAEVRPAGGTALAVSGLDRTEIGELAYRHGILLHELADRVVEQPVPRPVLPTGSGRSGQVRPSTADDGPPAPVPADRAGRSTRGPRHRGALPTVPSLLGGPRPPLATGSPAPDPRPDGPDPGAPGPHPDRCPDPYADPLADPSRAAGVHPPAATPRPHRSQ